MAKKGVSFKNLNQFNVDIQKFKDLTAEKHRLLLKKVAFQLLSLIVEKNPVKTGRSQNNWQVAVDKGTGTAALEIEGTKKIIQPDALAALDDIEAYSTVILYNNVEYIVALEKGSSTQAPAGMVAVSIEEVQAQFA